MTSYTVFIFRRDLRLVDNTALYYATSKFKNVIPIFIFTLEQVSDKNKFKSDNAIQFMKTSLHEVDIELQKLDSKLYYFYGENLKVLQKIRKKIKVERIVFNMDYTPYARKRDEEIEKWGEENEIEVLKLEDYLLYPIDTLLKKDENPYTIFTPFKNAGLSQVQKVRKVNKKKLQNLISVPEIQSLCTSPDKIKISENDNILVKGGRSHGLKILKKIKQFKKYGEERNTPSIPSTRMSAYIKFGNISIREVFHTINKVYLSRL